MRGAAPQILSFQLAGQLLKNFVFQLLVFHDLNPSGTWL